MAQSRKISVKFVNAGNKTIRKRYGKPPPPLNRHKNFLSRFCAYMYGEFFFKKTVKYAINLGKD